MKRNKIDFFCKKTSSKTFNYINNRLFRNFKKSDLKTKTIAFYQRTT